MGVRFRIYDSYMVFVNSHLAAGTKETDRRNLDFQEVSQKLLFNSEELGKVATIYDSEYILQAAVWKVIRHRWLNPLRLVFFAHAGSYLIWLGDLNYRIPMPAAQVKEMVAAKKFAKLLKADQVRFSLGDA